MCRLQINRYDAEGLRHEMEEDGRLVQFIFRGDEIAAEEKDSSVIRYIRGYDLIASDAESARTYYHYASDEMSSITHIVGSTHEMGADQVLNHYEYDAWGNTTVCEETVENRFRFNGQQYDPITQQYYLRARFYNPVIARFTQEDTYRGDGLNLYAYCANNPVYYEDPSGHVPTCVKEAIKKYVGDGMSQKDAKELAWAEYYDKKLANTSDLTPKQIKRYQKMQENRQKRLESGKKENRSVWGIIYQAEHLTGYDYDRIRDEANLGNVGKLKVLAVYENNGKKYLDVNPSARRDQNPKGVEIGLEVLGPKQNKVTLSEGGYMQTHTTRGVHPDTNTILRSDSTGGVGMLSVIGRDVCTACQVNTRLAASSKGVSDLIVEEYSSGKIYWFKEGKEFFAETQGGVTWESGVVYDKLSLFD